MLAVGIPAKVTGEVSGSALRWVENNPAVYRELARRHAASVRPVDQPS
jgi:carbonic anhydrase/acetyltransferase-like protein (isoleucine patch superfamily)